VIDHLLPTMRVTLHPLLIRAEGSGWIVGRQETGEFAEVPGEAVTLLRALEQGADIAAAEDRVLRTHGCAVDGRAFVGQIVDLGFVSSVNGEPCADTVPAPSLRWLRPGHVRWLFTWPVYLVIFTFILWNFTAALLQGRLVPGYHAYFVTRWQGFNIAWCTVLVMVTIALHEFAHLAAARSEGVPGKIGVGTRLVFLCAQTTVPGLWGASRRARFRVYLAGMVVDLIIISCCLLAIRAGHLQGFAMRSLEMLILNLWLAIATQLAVYTRTDGYFVLQELLRCKNLYHDAWQYLRYVQQRIAFAHAKRDKPGDPTVGIPANERLPVKIYSLLMLLSTGITLILVILYYVPICVTMFTRSFSEMFRGDLPQVADGIAAVAVEGSLLIVLIRTFIIEHRRQISGAATAVGSRLLRSVQQLRLAARPPSELSGGRVLPPQGSGSAPSMA
jgi:putative peptide zinc metalloprotease protein